MIKRIILFSLCFIPAIAFADTVVLVQRDAAASCGSATIATDIFTEAAGTIRLFAHAPTGGAGTWVDVVTSTLTPLAIAATDDLVRTTVTTGAALAVINNSIACYNYSVQIDYTPNNTTAGHRGGVLSRQDATLDQGYECRIVNSTGEVDIRRRTASTQVILGSTTVATLLGSYNSASTYEVRMDVNSSNQFTCFINDTGSVDLTRTDSTYTTGNPGIFMTNTGGRGDTWSATYLP